MTRFILMTAALACVAYGQGKGGPTTVSSDIKAKYNAIKNNVTAAADQMPESAYGFMPEGEPRSFAGWLAHVVDSQAGACGTLAGTPLTLGAAQMTSKADLVAALKKSYDACDAAYNSVTDESAMEAFTGGRGGPQPRLVALYGNIIHINECYGAMAVYMRLQKLTPPSSAGRGGRGPGGGKK